MRTPDENEALRLFLGQTTCTILARYRRQPVDPHEGEAWELAEAVWSDFCRFEQRSGLVEKPKPYLKTMVCNRLNARHKEAANQHKALEGLRERAAYDHKHIASAHLAAEPPSTADYLRLLRQTFDTLRDAMDQRRTQQTRLDYYAVFLLSACLRVDRTALAALRGAERHDHPGLNHLWSRLLPLSPDEAARQLRDAWAPLQHLRDTLREALRRGDDLNGERQVALLASTSPAAATLTLASWHQWNKRARAAAEAALDPALWRQTFDRWEITRDRDAPGETR